MDMKMMRRELRRREELHVLKDLLNGKKCKIQARWVLVPSIHKCKK